jgi:hypothetical protein
MPSIVCSAASAWRIRGSRARAAPGSCCPRASEVDARHASRRHRLELIIADRAIRAARHTGERHDSRSRASRSRRQFTRKTSCRRSTPCLRSSIRAARQRDRSRRGCAPAPSSTSRHAIYASTGGGEASDQSTATASHPRGDCRAGRSGNAITAVLAARAKRVMRDDPPHRRDSRTAPRTRGRTRAALEPARASSP